MSTTNLIETAKLLVEEYAEAIEMPTPNRMDVYLRSKDDLITVTAGLRVKRLGYLSAITGLDPGMEDEGLEIVYHFCTLALVINLRIQLPKDSLSVPSLCELVPSAEPYERELREMFGVTVTGLNSPEHLYLPDDWQEGIYPLRKAYRPEATNVLD